MRLYVPIKALFGRRLRVLIYARYSTEEQKRASIAAQFLLCRKYLREWGIEDAEIEELSDAEMSGELVKRPGIDQVRIGIKNRSWDLIVAEDSSRLFRNPPACCQLVGDAVDRGIRVLLPGDDIDTEEEGWMEDLIDAQMHHTRSNSITRKRIKRSMEELWEAGAAVCHLRPGYLRLPTHPASERKPAEGPFFDEIDPKWTHIIVEAFERFARGEPPWVVARWLTEAGLPKYGNSKKKSWCDMNVISMIRCSMYRGQEQYRKSFAKKVHGSGRSKHVRNDPSKVLTRPMEHLRIVSDGLWYRANEAIDNRRQGRYVRGLDHPLTGVPRDSRGPLSNVFFCICGAKMRGDGRNEGGYRCGQTKTGPCWNRATALREIAHKKISERVIAELLSAEGHLDAVVRHIERLFANSEPQKRRVEELTRQVREQIERRDNLLDALEKAKRDTPSILVRLEQREEEICRSQAELAELQREMATSREIPSREEIQSHLQKVASRLLEMDPEAGTVLKRMLDGPILAVPYRQFGSNKVVLRAEFKLRVVGMLPEDLFGLLQRVNVEVHELSAEVRTVVVDLFEPSGVPKHAIKAWDLKKAGKSVPEICQFLQVKLEMAKRAIRIGKEIEKAGLTDAYVRITERPDSVSRWRFNGPNLTDRGDSADHPDAA